MALGDSPSLVKRLLPKFLIGDGCWEWQASLTVTGYGQINEGGRGRPLMAHRVVYELLVGPIPPGMQLDHLCRNRACVRPAHLEAVTAAENKRRGEAGLVHRQRMAALTHCKHGHEFTEANTYMDRNANGNPRRKCRACANFRERRRRGYVAA